MNSQTGTPCTARRLTKKQRAFVRAYAWEHRGPSESVRVAYNTRANPHTISTWAYSLLRNPRIAEAIALAQAGDWDTLISCGVDQAVLAHRKLLSMVDDARVPHYVRQRALVDVLRYQPQQAAVQNRPTLEELEQVLRENVAVENDTEEEWDDLSLDDDPLPAPRATATIHESPKQADLVDPRFRVRSAPANSAIQEHPFLIKPRTRRTPF